MSICFELRVSWVVMGISTSVHDSFVCAGAVRMCTVLVRGLGMGCVLPTGQGVRPELILELVCYISRVYVPYGVRLG